MDEIRGLIKVSPTVGWGLMLGSLAILGMPPFGVFASEFLILTTAMREQPWATPFLLLALGVAFASVFGRVLPMVFGETSVKPLAHPPALLPVFVHLGARPDARAVRPALPRSAGTARRRGCSEADAVQIPGLTLELDRLPAPLPIWRGSVDADAWQVAARAVAASGGRLVALWGADRRLARAGGFAVCAAYALADGLVWLEPAAARRCADLPRPGAVLPVRGAHAARGGRPARHRRRRRARHPALARPRRLAAGPVPAARADRGRGGLARQGSRRLPVRSRRGRRRPRDPGRPGACRASSSRGTSASRSSARRCCAWRSGSATRTRESRSASPSSPRSRRIASPAGSPAIRRSPTPGPTAWRSNRRPAARCRRAPRWLRALMLERERVANHLGDLGALGNDAALAFGLAQFSRLREDWLRAVEGRLRPPADDGLRRAGRRRGRCRRRGRRRGSPGNATPSQREVQRAARDLRRARRPAGSLHRHRPGAVRSSPRELGLTGLAGRASGQATDLRCDHPWPPYDALRRDDGDATATATSRRASRCASTSCSNRCA